MAEETTVRIRGVMKDLRKVTPVFRLYGRDHPETDRITSTFVGDLVPLLDELGNLQLEVDADQLRVGDTVVFEDDESSDFAEVLYREGIERLMLSPGIDRQEILQLVHLLSLNLNLPGYEEETLTSLLWQADLSHIRYEAVEGLVEAVEQSEAAAAGEMGVFSDVLASVLSTQTASQADPETLLAPGEVSSGVMAGETMEGTYENVPSLADGEDGESETTSPAHFRPDPGREPTPFKQALLEASAIAGVSKPVEWTKERRSSAMQTIEWAEGFRSTLEVPAEDIAEYWKTLGADTFDSLLGSTMEATLFLAARPVNGLDGDDAIDLCRQGMQAALTNRETSVFFQSLEMLDGVLDAAEFADRHAELTALRNEWTDRQALARVCNTLTIGGEEPEKLAEFIERHTLERALSIRDLLGDIADPRRAEVVTDALLRALRRDPSVLTENLKQLEPAQLIPLYSCMARSQHPELQRQVRLSLHHPAADVRLHGLMLVMQQHDENTWRWLVPLAKDREPRVRLAALEMLNGAPVPGLERELRSEMTADAFSKRSPEEMRILAECYGRAGRSAAVATFQRLLGHRRWRLLSSNERPDVSAIMQGLLAAGTDESRLIVLRASRSWWPGLKTPAARALEKVEGRRG